MSETIPADGVDSLAVASVNTPLQKIADYLEALRTNYSMLVLPWSCTVGNAASTNYFFYAAATSQATTGAVATVATNGTEIWLPYQIKVRAYSLFRQNAVVGGTAQVFVNNNGTTTDLVAGAGGSVTSAILGTPITISLLAPNYLAAMVTNNAGVTTGYGICNLYLFCTYN